MNNLDNLQLFLWGQYVPMQMWAAVKPVYPIQQTSAGREALIFLWQL